MKQNDGEHTKYETDLLLTKTMEDILRLLHETKEILVAKHWTLTKASRKESIYYAYIKVQKLWKEAPVKMLAKLYSYVKKHGEK